MLTLSFDSTAKAASVAVCDGERLLASYDVNNGLTQSELLLPMAENMLKALKLSFNDIELLAASVGPGSFTGVRIGVSLVKGIAFGRGIPTVAVSTLEALAESLRGLDGVIVPVMDARRGQVYTAIFESDGVALRRVLCDTAMSIEELYEALKKYEGKKIYLSGDGYRVAGKRLKELGAVIENTPELLIEENAASVARVAIRKYLSGEYVKDTELSPTYLRMPQAERERLERLNNKN